MKEFQKLYPSFDVIYFGDRANCPYGGRTGAEIQILVESGVDWLAKQGCVIIILACNTAVAHTIRYLQNEKYPLNSGIKILGVTVPGAERVVEL